MSLEPYRNSHCAPPYSVTASNCAEEVAEYLTFCLLAQRAAADEEADVSLSLLTLSVFHSDFYDLRSSQLGDLRSSHHLIEEEPVGSKRCPRNNVYI